MAPLQRSLWRRSWVLPVYVVVEMLNVAVVTGMLELQLDEEQPAGTIVGDISAGLPPGVTASLFFISDHEGTGVSSDLDIDESTGIIKTAKVLDRELRDRYNFIAVTMTGVTVEVTVNVNDINDHAPTFQKKQAAFIIPEHTAIGTRFPMEPALDSDRGQLTTQGYLIKDGNVAHAFTLETRRGTNEVLYLDLVVNSALDREKRDTFTLTLEAFDGGSPKRTDQMVLDVRIQDINDHAPVFNQSRYHAIISENLRPGSNILQVFATDADEGSNGLVSYEINRRQSDSGRYFAVHPQSGIVSLNKALDFEKRRVHELVVQAQDNATQPEVTNAFVTIHVRDYNDNQPTMTIIFLSEDGSPRVSEGAQPGQYVARISVTDPDYGEYANVNVSLEGGDGKFELTTKDSIIYLMCVDQILDREERDNYELRVTATDAGSPPLRAESAFTIEVVDVNDNPPSFDQASYRQTVPEVVFPGSFVLQVTARDKDLGPNGDINYSILPDADGYASWFSIDSVTGIITTLSQLDYEKNPSPSITVMARDGGQPPLSSTAVVTVVLQNVNDNEPTFEKSFYNVSVREDVEPGTCFLQVTAADADVAAAALGQLSYSLGSSSVFFSVRRDTGHICTSGPLDRDQGLVSHQLSLTAADGGGLSSVTMVRVDVEDVNDHAPSFYPLRYAVTLSAQSGAGTSVLRVSARDPDSGDYGRVTYGIDPRTDPGGDSAFFTLNKDTGVISLSRSLRERVNSVVSVAIWAQDGGGLVAPVQARVDVSVVSDSVAPPVFLQAHYHFSVSEGALRGTEVGVVQAIVRTGSSEDPSYSISSGDPSGFFSVDPDSGSLRTNRSLDHESEPTLDLEVQARSGSPPAFGLTRVHVTVSDVNDNPPTFVPSSSESLMLSEHTAVGAVVYRVGAEDLDSGANGRMAFELTPATIAHRTFSLDRGTGEIRLVGSLSFDTAPRYDLLVVAKDHGVPQLSATFRLMVHVQEENHHGPVFDTVSYHVELREGAAANSRVLQVRALTRGPAHSSVTYRLRADVDASAFGIAADSGWLFVKSTIDREAKDVYMLTVLASDGQRTGSAAVRITVMDENDNSPKFSQDPVFLALRENLPAGTGFGHVTATDRDAGANGRVSYRLMHPDRMFQINPHTGELSTRRSLDREQQSSYQLLLLVQDGGSPSRSATATAFITVTDQNDHAPFFTHSQSEKSIVIQVPEGPAGTLLSTLQAEDPDQGDNGTVFFSLSGLRSECFSLHSSSGELRSSVPLLHTDHYLLTATATDHGRPALSSSCQLLIQVLDANRPRTESSLTFISEETSPGSVVGTVRLPGHQGALQGEVSYSVVGGDRDGTFVLDRDTGDVFLARALDYETDARHTLQIQVDDFSQTPPTSHMVQLQVAVDDSNDHAPLFPEDLVTIVVSENAKVGSSVYTFRAVDGDGGGPNSELRYSILQQRPGGLLSLHASSGLLSVAQALDREVAPSVVLVVRATDQACDVTRRRWSSVTVRLFVTDENDHEPAFCSPGAVSVMEDEPPGAVLLHVRALDPDLDHNGLVHYSLQDGGHAASFSLNPSTGSLSVSKPLDREQQDVFNLTVTAEDHGSPPRRSTQTLMVHVLDVNDEAPWFQERLYEAHVPENQPPGTSVLSVSASDLDLGPNAEVTYGLLGAGFHVDPHSGLISTTRTLDRERQEVHTLTVFATDGGRPPNVAETTVKIHVLDQNDHVPQFARLFYSMEVPEGTAPQPLCTLRAQDQDSGPHGDLRYRIIAGDRSGDFQLDPVSGVLSTSRPLDRELKPAYSLTVSASDRGVPPLSSTVTVEITVLDVNDHSPQFDSADYSADIAEDAPIGSLVLDVRASDRDHGANGRIMYFLSQGSKSAFIMDQNTGRILTTAPLDREKVSSYTFDVCAIDSSPTNPRNATARVTVYIQDVNDNAPYFTRDPLILNVSADAVSDRRVLATMKAEDKDFGANGSVFYRFVNPVRGFTINSLTGDIQATETLQELTQEQRTLRVQAVDQGSPPQSSLGLVLVYVQELDVTGVRFSTNTREVSLQENAPQGTVVTQIEARLSDGSQNGISYSLFSGNRRNSFGINTITGEVWVQSSQGLDFEDSPRLRLVVKAQTADSCAFMALNLLLQDVNDNRPQFHLQNYVAFIHEAQSHGSPIIQVSAEDEDQGLNAQLTYSLRASSLSTSSMSASSLSALFKIHPTTGSISTNAIMDHEIWSQTKLVVMATDRGSPPLVGSATLTVIIVDLNDNSPMIPAPQELRLPEDTMIGSIISQVTGNDVDSGPPLWYSLQLEPGAQGLFSIQSYGGALTLTGALDYESRSCYTLTIRSSDSQHQSETNLTVLVQDVNDNQPLFTQHLYQVTVSEHLPAGSAVVTVTATDRDSGDNGRITYRITSASRAAFSIDADNGTLFVNQKTEFDSENPSILVVIEARDHGTPSLSSVATVQVQISDVNDNAPIFYQSEYRATLSEDYLPGSTVLTLEATDGDLSRDNCGFDFTIASGNSGNVFQIESSVRFLEGKGFQTVGNIILVEELDFETVPKYNLTVVVSDRGVPQRSSSVPILISISDANDNPPAFSRAEYRVVLSEGVATGTEILHLSANDPDSAPNAEMQYFISSGDENDLFQVDAWTGALRLRKALDSESRTLHVIVVEATDGEGHYAFAPVTIEVKDINNNHPFFPLKHVTTCIRENQPQNALVTVLHAIDHDRGAYGQLKYFMLDDSKGVNTFLIHQTTGEIRTRSTFDFEKINSFDFVVGAMDAGNYSATVTVQVYINGMDEYNPVFTSPEFLFEVPDEARKGQVIGRVQATDEDAGIDGVVLYSMLDTSAYFEVNKSNGEISLKMDSYSRHVSRSKREVRQMSLEVTAHSPLETSRVSVAKVTVDVTHTAFGIPTDINTALVSVVAVSLGIIVILILIAIALFFVKLRRPRKYHKSHRQKPGSSKMMHRFEETKIISANEMLYHQALPGYTTERSHNTGPFTRGGSSDPSHSSGRGSAEVEAAEDDEIRMINEFPRVSSISSSMQERLSARGPDSGIQQDADQLSDLSIDASGWFKKKNGSLNGSIVSGSIYREDTGSYVSVGRGLSISHPKDYTFPVDGKPAADGSLTAIVATDEELRGSYNWDYLLNWCPQFQPLASVFTEIARLKDESAPHHSRRHFLHKAKLKESRIDPPPLITSVAHPGAKTVPPKPAGGRIYPHLGSFRRSPLSDQGSISSVAMSPSFSPSLSPLAARSPAVTPFSVTQGPLASTISATDPHLDPHLDHHLDPHLDHHLDHHLDPHLDHHLDPHLEHHLDPHLHHHLDPHLDPHLDHSEELRF